MKKPKGDGKRGKEKRKKEKERGGKIYTIRRYLEREIDIMTYNKRVRDRERVIDT